MSQVAQQAQPDVAVIVICYNDSAHLPAAVQSVLDQTLRNVQVIIVDDHSTDATPEVAAALCDSDPRVSYARLPTNSGGCGAPRNRGIELVEAPYVMFLDSDDTLERHACKNLLLAAEASGSDIVTGLVKRVNIAKDSQQNSWYPQLYDERRDLSSLADMPELLNDTLVTNKLYAARFLERTGLRFKEDLHYEDIIFSSQCLVQAEGISIIPETVYYWNIYPSEQRVSITNQRKEIKNLQDRLEAISIAREWFTKADSENVTIEFELKVLSHHLMLYINDLELSDDRWAEKIFAHTSDSLSQIHEQAFNRLPVWTRLTYYAFLSRDFVTTRRQITAKRFTGFVGNIVNVSPGMYEWHANRDQEGQPEHPENLPPNFVEPHLATLPFSKHSMIHLLHNYTVKNDLITVHGESFDPYNQLRENFRDASLILKTPSGTMSQTFPIHVEETTGDSVIWSAQVRRPQRHRIQETEKRFFELRVVLTSEAENTSPVRMIDDSGALIKSSSAVSKALGDYWKIAPEFGGQASFGIEVKKRGIAARRAVKQLLNAVPNVQRAILSDKYTADVVQTRIYQLFRRLPVDRNVALFESNLGGSAFDNPRAVFEEMRKRHPEMKYIWSHDGSLSTIRDLLDTDATLVKRHSAKYVKALATAKYLVDNQSFPRYFVKREGQKYLQTWHGIPLKKLGFDVIHPENDEERRRVSESVENWDLLNIPNEYFEQTFVPSFKYQGELVRYGSPRNDDLAQLSKDADRLKRKLDLPADVPIVLYAPTYRDGSAGNRNTQLLLDLEQWNETVGEKAILLIRSHYLNRFFIPPEMRSYCIDVSDYGNVSELYAISDALVTDYSSVMFDYALLGRPIVIFAPDYDDYMETRGTYFDLKKNLPGPFVEDSELIAQTVMSEISEHSSRNILEQFRDKFADSEVGSASANSVTQLLSGKD